MTLISLAPVNGGWQLPVAGEQISRLGIDVAAVRITLSNSLEVVIEQPFIFIAADGSECPLDPGGDAPGLAPLLSIMRKPVDGAHAFSDGRLEIKISDLSEIHVPAHADFEAWSLTGPGGIDGLKVVSMPGGELAIWEDRR